MTDKLDPSQSAQPCGCDSRENYFCNLHRKDIQCVAGHWIRRDNCPACQVLLDSPREKKENAKDSSSS